MKSQKTILWIALIVFILAFVGVNIQTQPFATVEYLDDSNPIVVVQEEELPEEEQEEPVEEQEEQEDPEEPVVHNYVEGLEVKFISGRSGSSFKKSGSSYTPQDEEKEEEECTDPDGCEEPEEEKKEEEFTPEVPEFSSVAALMVLAMVFVLIKRKK